MDYSELIGRALETRQNAYAPYSGFKVGAALRTRSGKVFSGVNVENASFGMTICAERAAIAAAVSAGDSEIVAIAIVTDSSEPAMPCGACRQILAEFNAETAIVASTTTGKQQTFVLSELLPRANQGLTKKNV